MEEIVIPNLDDDDDDNYPLPAFAKPSFGSPSSTSSSPEVGTHPLPDYGGAHRSHPSSDNLYRHGMSTPGRPHSSKGSTSHSMGSHTTPSHGHGASQDEPRLGKFSNGSNTSLVTNGTSIGSAPGFSAPRKGSKASLTSIRNAFKTAAHPVPPVPNSSSTTYPALKNPFSRYNEPASPSRPFTSSRGGPHVPRKSTASARSIGTRSATSQSSRPDDQVPALPPIPTRSTPSRMGRHGSDAASIFAFKRHGSVSALDGIEEGPVATAGEEASRVVWREFRAAADGKVSRICGRPLNTHPSLSAYSDSGIDPVFDTLIASLANCARRYARAVADSSNGWCRMHCEGIGASEVRAHLDRSLGSQMRVEDAAAILGGRKSSTARFISNRALIELVSVVPKESLGEESGMVLEQNAFNAYKTEKSDETAQVPHRKAVSQSQVELLGHLSTSRFLTISDRFTRELGKYASAQPTRDNESRIEHLLRGMRHSKMRVYPENELEMSADFITQLAVFFNNVHGQSLKCAYAETFISLLHPVVETATAEVNHPTWSKAIATILSRSLAMMQKPRYWPTAFPLIIILLGVSPRETFLQHWPMCIDNITSRLKDRSSKIVAMNCLTRLLWIYLNRCSESSTSTRKRLDPIVRTCFHSVGGSYPSEIPLEPFAHVLHFIMARQLDFGDDFISDFLRDGSEQAGLADRATSLIKAIGYTLKAIEDDRPATWPKNADFSTFGTETFESSGDSSSTETAGKQEVNDFMKKCSPAIVNRLFACDRSVSHSSSSNDAVSLSAHASSSAMQGVETIMRKHGDVHVSYPSRYDPILRSQAAILDVMPRTHNEDASIPQIANILSRGTFSSSPAVCVAASEAMRRYAQNPLHCAVLVNTYSQFVFETRHVFRDTFVGLRSLDSQFERVVRLWVDLSQALVGHQRIAEARDEEQELQGITPNSIDKIDGVAMFLLCSSSVPLRRLASQVLAAARDLEGQQRRPSAAFRYSRVSPDRPIVKRVIQSFDATSEEHEAAKYRSLSWLTSSDRTRFDMAVAKDRVKLLQRIAESEHPKDGSLWSAILPRFVDEVYEQSPGPAQDLRSIVIATVLRLQGHVASTASVSASRATPGMRASPSTRMSSDTGVLADYWRSYSSVLTVTMPSQSTTPATPPVQRTKEAVISTPDTIGSPALFHYLTSILTWEDPRFKDAAVYALGSVGADMLRPLSEILLGVARRLADGSKIGVNSRDSRRGTNNGPLWTSLAHVFRLVSPLILETNSAHLANSSSMIGFVKLTFALSSDRAVKEDFDSQSLRRSFCIVVENSTNALGKLDSSDRFLGEEMRGAVFKLCYEWCHVGRRPDVAKARESHTLQAAAEGYRGDRDRAQYLDDSQAKTKLLSAAAAEAMAGLCQGKLISSSETTPAAQSSEHIIEPLTVSRWIRGMFSSSSSAHHETGRKASFALLKYNWRCSRSLDEVSHQSFGEGEQFVLGSSFFAVVADVVTERLVELPIEQLACLALSKLGHPIPDIRLRAFQLAQSLDPDYKGAVNLLPAVGGCAPIVYRQAQQEMSLRLAEIYPDNALEFSSECTTRSSQSEAPRRQATLSILPAWMGVSELAPDTTDAEVSAQDHRASSNLVYSAVRFSDDHSDEIRQVFLTFAGEHKGNITALVKFLFEQGGKRKSPEFVGHAQRIIACLAQSDAAETLFEEIFNFVEPSAMASLSDVDVPPSPAGSSANLDALSSAPSTRSQTFSAGQLASSFSGELLPYRLGDVESSKRSPTLSHVALVHVDNPGPALRDQCQAVLFQVLRAWIASHTSASPDAIASIQSAERKLSAMNRARNAMFWRAEDDGGPTSAFLAPPKMTTLVMKISGILLPLHPRIKQTWGELALAWATSCPIRHSACRSFQAFRILSPKISPRMSADTLARLSSTIASSSPEIQAFNLEVLRTFAAITQDLSMSDMASYPQIFWCSVACLTTPFEEEYLEVVELLSHVLDKTNSSDPAVVSHLVSFRPSDWVGPTPHSQRLLSPGLRSSKTDMMSFDLIRRSASCAHDDLIDPPEERLSHGFIAALPWMLHSTDLGEPNEDLGTMASDLAALAETSNPSLSRSLTSFAHARFRSKDDFVRQAASLSRDYLRQYALDIITISLGFALNDNEWMREKSMQSLKMVFASPEARAQVQIHGNELLQPLLRLVSTKHSAQALDVLDSPVTSDSPVTGKIFGPVSPSGWSVPNAKDASVLARDNVTAVFNTCAQETRAASAHFSVVQFADIRAFNPSQSSSDIPSPPVTGSQATGHETDNTSMGDLVGALHSLNQFFDDGLDGTSTSQTGHTRIPSETPSGRRIGAIMARNARGRHPSMSSPIYETSVRRQHKHTLSEMTSSSISSMADVPDDRKQFYGLGGSLAARNGREEQQRHHHHQQQSYSSTNTDGEGYVEEKSGSFNLDEGDTSSISLAQSAVSEESGTNQSTPVTKRAWGGQGS